MLPPGGHRDIDLVWQAMRLHKVSVLYFVPSMFASYLDDLKVGKDRESLATLRAVVTSGEALPLSFVRSFYEF